jgi:TldD protein
VTQQSERQQGQYFSDHFGLDESLIREAIAHGMSQGGEYAEVFLQHAVTQQVVFEDGHVNSASVRVELGAGLRVLDQDQTGYASTEDLSPEGLKRAATTAAAIARGGAQTASGPATWQTVKSPQLYPNQRVWEDVPPASTIAVAETVGQTIGGGDPAVVSSRVRLVCQDNTVLIANSAGQWAEDTRPMTVVAASCVAKRNGRRESNGYNRSVRQGLEYYSADCQAEIAREAVRRTMLLFDAGPPPAGEMPVVLAPATSGILLHEAVGHGFEADFNRKGRSIYSTMMGQQICPDFVTIVDSGLEPMARGALQVDDEATPGQATVLVEKGRLVSYLHDRMSAAHYNVAPTGNGRRQDYRFPPLPRMRVTSMEAGPHDPEEIVASVDHGLYVHDFANGEVAIGAGDYSFYVKTGYLIEKGKLTRPVKDANLIGNGPDSLSKVVMVGRDAALDQGGWTCGKDGQGIPVGLGLPTVKVSSIIVGGVNQ